MSDTPEAPQDGPGSYVRRGRRGISSWFPIPRRETVAEIQDAMAAQAAAQASAEAVLQGAALREATHAGAEANTPRGSLLASAVRITSGVVASSTFRRTTHETWQDDAWAMFDLVGEFRFLANTIADRQAQARLYVGKISEIPGEDPIPVEDSRMQGLLDSIGDGHVGLGQIVKRASINLWTAGDCWLVGIPKDALSESLAAMADANAGEVPPKKRLVDRNPINTGARQSPGTAKLEEGNYSAQTLDDLDWRILSVNEITFNVGGNVRILLGPTEQEVMSFNPDDIYLIRIWRPHPRYWWRADSPTRASLPILRELVGLTMHVSAQVDSRLAGAGLLVVPESASVAMKRSMGLPDDSEQDPFVDALMQSMITPIGDRSNASAVVPLVVTAPDQVTGEFKFLDFARALDTASQELREEAIRRLALGLDSPPELLLGQTDANHWGAWLTAEEVVHAHVEPPLALFCDALTTQFLRPMLLENGIVADQNEAEQYVVWMDTGDLIIQPNKPNDAQFLYNAGELSGKALRAANGFDEADAPGADEPAIKLVATMLEANPGLLLRPGADVLFAQAKALYAGKPLGAVDGTDADEAAQSISGASGAPGASGPQPPGATPQLGTGQPPVAVPGAPTAIPTPTASQMQPSQQGNFPPGGPPAGGPAPTIGQPSGIGRPALAVEPPQPGLELIGQYTQHAPQGYRRRVMGSLAEELAKLQESTEETDDRA